ncbi:(d)CMP kinase [Ureaplasma diversum]|uniref:Cytidylate kinase n=1 Tax=Ureaplasma diversum NCTC 246 TaxID=1188241 RepID=A0A084EZE6_9BACT|nr:(d)CMP kinase [Ureaplasma diversum]KEZ23338.1 Cytidylate kinase [Ureaplasma diversum NCTC 246]
MDSKTISIAVDGPSGSGKSSASKVLAQRLGFLYVNTGAMYRAYAYFLFVIKQIDQQNIDFAFCVDLLKATKFTFNGDDVFVEVNNQTIDLSLEIRLDSTALLASKIAQNVLIRDFATAQQRKIAEQFSVVMDGRDIGTVVLVDAFVKFYLETSVEIRANRRFKQNQELGIESDYEKIYNEILERDNADKTRAIAPLKPATDALIIYNDGMNVEQCVDVMHKYYLDLLSNK